MKHKLILVMNNFPYGTLERSFILPELPFLIKKFDITIISTSSEKKELPLDPAIKVHRYKISITHFDKCVFLIKFFFNKFWLKEVIDIICTKKSIISRLRESFDFLCQDEKFYMCLTQDKILYKDLNALYYTYWEHYKCLAMTLHKKRYKGIKIISRIHGYDLYNERCKSGRQPFKKLMDNRLDRLYFVSHYGLNYYLKHHVNNQNQRYKIAKLGTINCDEKFQIHRTNMFTMVSCSRIVEVKRITLIIEALAQIKSFSVKWIHFGDGGQIEYVKEYAKDKLDLNSHIIYSFKGQTENQEIQNYYRENYVDVFITTSASEGAPVSIMEALSYGIPIIGTAVGDIPYMINGNGILLGPDPSSEEVASAIINFNNIDNYEIVKMRQKSRDIWNFDYNANENYKNFVNEIAHL